jgi:hypothetical protein
MTSPAAPISAAAEQQHYQNDYQDQFHGYSPLMVFDGGGARRAPNPSIGRSRVAHRFFGVAFGFQLLVAAAPGEVVDAAFGRSAEPLIGSLSFPHSQCLRV